MDRNGLRQAIPGSDQLHGLNPIARKKAVEDAIEAVLNAIGHEQAAPDLWETDHLLLAMAAVLRGQYWLACANLENALAPEADRSPEAKLEANAPWPIGQLERTLQAVRAAPVG